jgi:hypothetical protein
MKSIVAIVFMLAASAAFADTYQLTVGWNTPLGIPATRRATQQNTESTAVPRLSPQA